MSKADRSIKEKIKYNRSITPQTEEENSSTLPKIETKKPLANITTESYNFVSSVKKSGTSRDSIPGIISKDLVGSLTPQERALVEELAKKIEEQRKEIDQRNQTLMAIQRNFEGLSTMLKKEKELGAENKKRVLALTEDNNKLAEENRVLTKRVDDMIERLKKYEHELDSSAKDKKKINQSIEEQEALKSKIQELQSILERKKKEISDLEAKNKSLSAQIDKLKNTITGLESENKQSGLKLKEAKAELENSNKENDKLQKAILEYKLKAGDFDKLKEEHASLLVKKGDVDKENKELINEISVLRHEVTTLKNHNKKLEEGVQTQNMQLRFGNQKEDALAQEVKELKKLLEARDTEILELNLKVGDLQTSLQGEVQHRLKYKDLIERYDTLTKDGSEIRLIKKIDVDKINTDLEQLRAKTADYDELKKKVERLTGELQKKNEMIDRYVSEKQFESGNNSKLNERIRALEEENKRLASHNQKLISALDFKNENEKIKDGQLNAEIESLKQKLDANVSSLGDINSKHKTLLSEKEALAKQVDIMKREIDIKNREMDSMKNKIDKLEAERDTRNREIDSLKKKIDNLESERDSKLKESDSNTTQLRKELSGLRDQYKTLQDSTDKSISSLNKQVEDLKATNNRKDEEISQLKSSLSQTKSSLEAVTQENMSSQKALQSLQTQVKDLKGTLEIKENQVDAFKKENGELTAELEAKTKEAQGLARDVSELQDRIRTLAEKNDDLNKKNQEMAATLKQLLNDLHLARLRHKQSESTIEDLELKLKQTLNKLGDLDELKFRDKLAKLEDREKQFNKVVAKMDHAQSSLLISLSCCECMSSLKNPVTFLPCAHNYCEKCVPKNGSCKECGDHEPEYQYRNKLLEDVITKVSYNQVILESIKPKDD